MRRFLLFSGPNYSAAAKALFAAATTQPSQARKALYNSTLNALASCGYKAKADGSYLLAAADSQIAALNLINPSAFGLSQTGTAPTFLADRGFTGNGTSSGLTGPNLATFGGKYALNDSHIWVWCGTDVTEGASDCGNSQDFIQAHATTTLVRTRANDATTTGSTLSVNTAVGLTLWNRTASGTYDVYKNGILINTISVATTSITSSAFGVCFAGATFSTKRIQAVGYGASLTPTAIAGLQSAMAGWMTAVGA